jgi:preprotein translocase subunit SecG
MYIFIIVLIIVAAVLLVLVVLAQNSKGGGLASQFGGAGSSQLMGVKKTGDLLEKLTWGFAIAILVLSLSSNFFFDRNANPQNEASSPNIEKAQEKALIRNTVPGMDSLNLGGSTDTTAKK